MAGGRGQWHRDEQRKILLARVSWWPSFSADTQPFLAQKTGRLVWGARMGVHWAMVARELLSLIGHELGRFLGVHLAGHRLCPCRGPAMMCARPRQSGWTA